MKHRSKRDRTVENKLARHRLAPPSPVLRERVLRTARQAWPAEDCVPGEAAWPLPTLRFAACWVVAALLIVAANLADARLAASYRVEGRESAVSAARPHAGSHGRPGLAALASAAASRSAAGRPERLLGHLRRVEKMLHPGAISEEAVRPAPSPQSRLREKERCRNGFEVELAMGSVGFRAWAREPRTKGARQAET